MRATASTSDRGDAHLDLAGRQAGVDRLGVAGDDRAADAHHELGAQPLGEMVRLGREAGIEDELHEAGAVAQVDEDEIAVVAPAGHPAGQPHVAPDVGDTQLAGQRRTQLTERCFARHASPPPLPPRGLPLPLP